MTALVSNPRVLVLILAVWYFLVGYGSAVLDPSVPARMRFAWRLAAWIACGVAFAAHIVYLQFKFRKPPRATAIHAAVAVALGAFLLALAAAVHALMVASHAAYWKFLVALFVWPLITACPAFVVALSAGWVLSRFFKESLTHFPSLVLTAASLIWLI
jgi:hypothetical protein